MNYILALFGMTSGEFTVFLTALGTGLVSLVTAFFTWKGKRDAESFELKRMEKEEERIEIEAKNKLEERQQIAKEKQEQHIRDIELARLTRETAKGIQESISRTSKDVKKVVEDSKEERRKQIEEVKAINIDALDKANNINEKILNLGLTRNETPLPAEVTNFPTEEQ